MIGDHQPFKLDSTVKSCIAQTLVDESFHTLISLDACETIRKFRHLKKIALGNFEIISNLEAALSAQNGDEFKMNLIRFAVAVTSETIISDYLHDLSKSKTIQPFCRQITDSHRKDEMVHSGLFINLFHELIGQLDSADQNMVIGYILRSSYWFAAKDLSLWEQILRHIKFKFYRQMLEDTQFQEKYCWLHDHKKITKLVEAFIYQGSNIMEKKHVYT
jgi:hypothetical protein